MARRVSSSWVVGVMATSLALAPQATITTPVDRVHVATRTDLDTFSDERLDRDLQAELNEVFKQHSPDAVADVDAIQDAIMDALSDEGDTGPAGEITLADLEAEMHEDGTDVATVVHAAIERLDHASAGRRTIHLAVWRGNSGPGYKPTYGLAVRDAKRSLIQEIRKAR